jgi:hypothetical protein
MMMKVLQRATSTLAASLPASLFLLLPFFAYADGIDDLTSHQPPSTPVAVNAPAQVKPYSVVEILSLLLSKSFDSKGVYKTSGSAFGGVWWSALEAQEGGVKIDNKDSSTVDPRALAFDKVTVGECRYFYISDSRSAGGHAFDLTIKALFAKNEADQVARSNELKQLLGLIENENSPVRSSCGDWSAHVVHLKKVLNIVIGKAPEMHQILNDAIAKKTDSEALAIQESEKAKETEREIEVAKKREARNSACTVFEDFKDNNDGTLTDPRTGLIWQKCAVGQKWDGKTCNGSAEQLTWFSAMIAAKQSKNLGMSDWRLPTSTEFRSVARSNEDCQRQIMSENGNSRGKFARLSREEEQKKNDVENSVMILRRGYPDSRAVSDKLAYEVYRSNLGKYWSITPDNHGVGNVAYGDKDSEYAAYANFQMGEIGSTYRSESYAMQARLVRGGIQSKGEGVAEFDLEYKRATQLQQDFNKQLAASNEQQRNHQKELERGQEAQRAYAAKAEAYRKNIQVGDRVIQGLVLEVKGNLIKVQVTDTPCSKQWSNGSCAAWTTVVSEKYFQRSEILPRS